MFCRNCGKELCENAFVCPDCGVLVNGTAIMGKGKIEKNEVVTEDVKENKHTLFNVFLIVSFSCACLALIFSIASILFAEYDVNVREGSYAIYAYFEIWFNEPLAIFSFIFGLCAFGLSVVAFILGFNIKQTIYKIFSILNFIFSFCICFLSIMTVSCM